MKTLHTKGPWQVKHSESKPAFNVIGTRIGEKYKIARCPYYPIGLPVVDNREKSEAEANARLIAASPTMLEGLNIAAKTLSQIPNVKIHFVGLEEMHDTQKIASYLETIITKATGEKESNHAG